MTRTCCQLVVALSLVVSAFAQTSNNANRDLEANLANVAFLQQHGLSLQEAQLLSDSAAIPGAEIPILEDVRDGPWYDGSYYFRYTSADGSQREEGGIPTAPCTLRVTGSYSYIAPNGELIDMEYLADENGYRAFPAGTRPDLYTAPVRVPEPIFPVGYFDGIPCPGDEFNNQGGQQPPAAVTGGNRRPVTPPRPTNGRPNANGRPNGRPTPTFPVRPTNGGRVNGNGGRPTTGGRLPTTGNGGRPTTAGRLPTNGNGGGRRPTTSTQVRPNNYGNQGGYGSRQTTNPSQGITTPDAGYKTPTSLITAASTNVNVQNNYNTGGTTLNEGYSYTEPSRTFTFKPQNPENTVTTDLSVAPQTTPIEPLTQLYESPNY